MRILSAVVNCTNMLTLRVHSLDVGAVCDAQNIVNSIGNNYVPINKIQRQEPSNRLDLREFQTKIKD